jgi:hypothetical protein
MKLSDGVLNYLSTQRLITAASHALSPTIILLLLPPPLLQVSRQGVFDVGLVTPSHLQPFFRSCSFELDREESVPMAISSSWWKEPEVINAGLQANPALQKLLQTAMDDEQRRLFTRCA